MTTTNDKCAVCAKSKAKIDDLGDRYECSHIDCPLRKRLTAGLSGAASSSGYYSSGGAPDNAGCFTMRPKFGDER